MRLLSKWRQYHAHSAKSFAPRGKQLPTISAAAAPASEKEHAHGSFRPTCARAVLEQVSQETRSCSFPLPFSLKGSRGKFSFPLPFSLTLQTATRRLLTTHPYSSDFPFVFSVVCVSPRFGSRSARRVRFPMGREPPQGAVIPDRGKSNICHQVKTKQKKTLWHQARRS